MRVGTLTFQAYDKTDVFFVANVEESGIETSDEAVLQIEDSQFDGDKAWVTGNVPRIKPINIEGDTAIINAWFKGENYEKPVTITVYVECETAEEFDEVIEEAIEQDRDNEDDDLEPMEINL